MIIFGLLPILAFILIFILLAHDGTELGYRYIVSLLIWGVIIAGGTEILSLIEVLNQTGLLVFWLIVNLTCIGLIIKLQVNIIDAIKKISQAFLDKGIMLIPVVFVLVITLITALMSAPNFWDAITYHMSRVAHWAQNGSINHYVTNDARQLVFPPFPEFAILHFYVLMGSDLFANLIQWFSMSSSAIIVYMITKQLGGKPVSRSFAVVVAITIPMGILQASSVQSDFILGMWIGCFAYLVFNKVHSNKILDVLLVGSALGLAIFTKSHAYIFCLPFVIWYGLVQLKNYRLSALRNAVIIGVVVLMINVGHYTRNVMWYDSPVATGTPELERAVNGRFGIDVTVSNMVRNTSFHLGTNRELSQMMTEAIVGFHEILGMDVNDPDTTESRMEFLVIPAMSVESVSGAPFHFILIILSSIIIITKPELRRDRRLMTYIGLLILAYIILSSLLNWTQVSARHQLTLFILASPMVGIVLETVFTDKSLKILSFAMLILALPYLFSNLSRPIVVFGENSKERETLLNSNRFNSYFFPGSYLQPIFQEAVQAISSSNCRNIGLRSSFEAFEYLLWVSLAETGDDYSIYHINDEMQIPNSKAEKLSGEKVWDVCALVYLQDIHAYYPKYWDIEGEIIYQSPGSADLKYMTVSLLQ